MPHYTLTLSGRATVALITLCFVVGYLMGRLA